MSKETGFPSPAQGYELKSIDLNEMLIKNPPATYLLRYKSSDLIDLGIFPESILVVDRSLRPQNDRLVVFGHEGLFRCRKWFRRGPAAVLVNGTGEELSVSDDVTVFGVVRTVIRTLI